MNVVFDARLTDVNLSWNKQLATNASTVKVKEMNETGDNAWSKCYKHNQKLTLSIFTLVLLILTHAFFFELYPLWILVSMNIVCIDPAIMVFVCTEPQQHTHIILLHFCAFSNYLNYIQHQEDLKYLYFVISSIIAIHVLILRTKHNLLIPRLHYFFIITNILCSILLKILPTSATKTTGVDITLITIWLFNVIAYYFYKSNQEVQNLPKS